MYASFFFFSKRIILNVEQKNAQILQVMRFENNADKTVYLAHILKKNVLKYYTNEIRSFFLYVLLIRCN